ncbi:MAG: methyltransferase, partial [bacterium]
VTYRGRIFRVVSRYSLDDWRDFSASPLCDELQRDALLIPTRPAPDELRAQLAPDDPAAVVLEHDRVPVVSYPYEWTCSMLRDAALLHLDLLERALARGFVLKDATPYNVQFLGARPVFIDVLSFARYQPGDPWAGYNQFCKMMLYPLMLEAYKRVPFQPWLRSELEGLDPLTFSRLLGLRDLLRPGVFTHVKLHAWLQQKMESERTSVRGEIQCAGLSRDALLANIRGLRRLLNRLAPQGTTSHWSDYERTCTYDAAALKQKEEFVRRAALSRDTRSGSSDALRRLVWDLGANVGHFSRLAAEHAATVVALDTDAASIDRLYLALKKERHENILPLLMNVANPSPDQGWRGRERR